MINLIFFLLFQSSIAIDIRRDLYHNSAGNVAILFSNIESNRKLQNRFSHLMNSIFRYSTIPLNFFVIGDRESFQIAERLTMASTQYFDHVHRLMTNHRLMRERMLKVKDIPENRCKFSLNHIDLNDLSDDLINELGEFQKRFSHKPGAYYSDRLFFISLVLHRLPNTKLNSINRLIMLDIDLQFQNDIAILWNEFSHFKRENLIGLVPEMQPVYRHMLVNYRQKNPGTLVGGSIFDSNGKRKSIPGQPGFNSGVALFYLSRLRSNKKYEKLMEIKNVDELIKKYEMNAHLGDQDVYSLVSFNSPKYFHNLHCSFNYQLCQWWYQNGYENKRSSYYKCDNETTSTIIHGNCDTLIPTDIIDEMEMELFRIEEGSKVDL
ncbi:hypothetical protein SNEBB_007886 [Seison nebaliae]|nr:hypothetical protein SNEBB_007886 [Seison nebaliae]